MSRSVLQSVVTLAFLVASVSGLMAISGAPALAEDAFSRPYEGLPDHALRSGFVPSAWLNGIANANGQLNSKHEEAEDPFSRPYEGLPEHALRIGFVPSSWVK
jgi:hypothetical protein